MLKRQPRARSELFRICIYCGGHADSKDHVPPRSFLERPYPPNLLTVPSCKKCNRGFSLDEEYCLIAMSLAGFSGSLLEKVREGGVVDRALAYSPGLDDLITQNRETDENGRGWLRPDLKRFANVLVKIARGLFFLRYGHRSNGRFGPAEVFHEHQVPAQIKALACGVPPVRFWPEVGTRALERAVRKSCLAQDREPNWERIQTDVFEYLFIPIHSGWRRSWCLVRLHRNFWGVVLCPPFRR